MKTQDSRRLGMGLEMGSQARLAAGQTIHPGRGRLEVIDGVVWLTRRGDPQDHLLARGEAIEIRGHDEVLFEPWGQGQAIVDWQPLDRQTRLRREAAGFGSAVLRFAAARCAVAAERLGRAADHLARLTCTPADGATRRSCSA